MSNSKGLSVIEAIVAVLVGAVVVLAIGGLGGRLIHHRTTTSSNSAAMNIAERQMETLLAENMTPPDPCTVAHALCGNTSSVGLLHGPTRVDVRGAAAAGGEFSISYWVKDNSDNLDSPLLKPDNHVDWKVKQLRVRVTHVTNRAAAAELVRYVTIFD